MRRLQLHEVHHQVGDVQLPAGIQQVAGLAPGAGALGHKLGEDPHGGVLELQGAAAAPALLLLLVLTLPRGPGGRRSCSGWDQESAVPTGPPREDILHPPQATGSQLHPEQHKGSGLLLEFVYQQIKTQG